MVMNKMFLVGAAMLASVVADGPLCGTYTASCQVPEGGDAAIEGELSGKMSLQGATAGQFDMEMSHYDNVSACGTDTPIITTTLAGSFNDFGGNPSSSGIDLAQRRMVFNVSLLTATPQTPTGLDLIRSICACGNADLWKVGSVRILTDTSCPLNNGQPTCDLSFFIGGTPTQMGSTLTFGQPIYGIMNEADQSSVNQSLFSSTSLGGWTTNLQQNSYALWTRSNSCVSQSLGTMCGKYQTTGDCSMVINPYNLSSYGSESTTMFFRGPLGNLESTPLNEFGVYNRTRTFFSDTACKVPVVNTYEYGSMGLKNLAQDNVRYVVSRQQSNIIVTPLSDAEVIRLNEHCPCGSSTSAWKKGTQRLLTTCPDNTCDQQYWNDFLYIGSQAFAYVNRNDTDLADGQTPLSWKHLSFSLWNDTEAKLNGYELITSLDQTEDGEVTCGAGSYADAFCGVYESFCSETVGTPYDSISTIILTGLFSNDTTADEGKIQYTNNQYDGGQQCQSSANTVEIIADGFFTAGNEAVVVAVAGLNSTEIQYTSYRITSKSDGFTSVLNDAATGCKCGGTWITNTQRTITQCSAGTCSDDFIQNFLPGFLNEPGFGVLQLSTDDNGLRLSTLQKTNDGYATGFTADTVISYSQANCPSFSNKIDVDTLSSCWELPCYKLGETGGFEATGLFDILKEGSLYTINRTVFPANAGCSDYPIVSAMFDVFTAGDFSVESKDYSTGIANGKLMTLTPYVASIHPRTTSGATFLNTNCSSCGNFFNGVTTEFTSKCDCPDLEALLGFPIMQSAYGIVKAWDTPDNSMYYKGNDFIRMTDFTSKLPSVTATFTKVNGEYGSTDNNICPLAPQRPNPSSSTGLEGGDVFILLFFISATVYCGVGMGMNYRRTGGMSNGGTPIIPHLHFWREVPGLVSDGMKFTFCQMCGLKKSSGFQSFGSANGDYGAL